MCNFDPNPKLFDIYKRSSWMEHLWTWLNFYGFRYKNSFELKSKKKCWKRVNTIHTFLISHIRNWKSSFILRKHCSILIDLVGMIRLQSQMKYFYVKLLIIAALLYHCVTFVSIFPAQKIWSNLDCCWSQF